MHIPSQPLMRSPLLRFQTPVAPYGAVGFFGSGCPAGCLAGLIAQPTRTGQYYSANLFSRRQFFTLVFRDWECSDVRHKFYEQGCSFLLKRGVMPRVAALVPTRMAQGLSGWDDSRPDFLLLLSGED